MPTLREVRNRISGVKKTQKITRAMKMVSAAKLRRAQEAIVAARPYARQMREVVQALARRAGRAHPVHGLAPRVLRTNDVLRLVPPAQARDDDALAVGQPAAADYRIVHKVSDAGVVGRLDGQADAPPRRSIAEVKEEEVRVEGS